VAEEAGDLALYIESVESRVHIHAIHFRGDFAKGIARLQELLTLLDRAKIEATPLADELRLRFYIVGSLILVAIRYGDYALALHYSQIGIALADAVGQRHRRMHFLLNLALAEQFAGDYAAATAHNLEALACAEEIGDVDEMALLKANLCLTLRQSGALTEALAYGLDAIEMLVSLGNKRIEGQARNRVGHTLAALARWADAYAAYGEALAVWAAMQHPNRYEAVAGRAVAALQLGKHAEALALVEEALDFVTSNGLIGIVEPVRLYLNCEAVLTAVGLSERAHHALLQADDWVQTMAGRISAERVRATFLTNRPDNQLLKSRVSSLSIR
jgi:tetratricopeptide (TPR) repeat protein